MVADKMGKETTFMAVSAAGLVSAGSIVALQRYLNVWYDKNGEKFASPGFSFLPKAYKTLSPSSAAKTF